MKHLNVILRESILDPDMELDPAQAVLDQIGGEDSGWWSGSSPVETGYALRPKDIVVNGGNLEFTLGVSIVNQHPKPLPSFIKKVTVNGSANFSAHNLTSKFLTAPVFASGMVNMMFCKRIDQVDITSNDIFVIDSRNANVEFNNVKFTCTNPDPKKSNLTVFNDIKTFKGLDFDGQVLRIQTNKDNCTALRSVIEFPHNAPRRAAIRKFADLIKIAGDPLIGSHNQAGILGLKGSLLDALDIQSWKNLKCIFIHTNKLAFVFYKDGVAPHKYTPDPMDDFSHEGEPIPTMPGWNIMFWRCDTTRKDIKIYY